MASSTVSLGQLKQWLAEFRDQVVANQAYLTELDSAIGDADHGTNMARGMNAVMEKIAAAPAATVDELFKSVGMTLVTSVGGASGPLYGTFFMRLGMTAGAQSELTADQLAAALRAGLEGVVARGKAEAGDKTMFDPMSSALAALDTALATGAGLASATAAAEQASAAARDATKPLVARKGRASYLGERSANHIDPGSESTALLFHALAIQFIGG